MREGLIQKSGRAEVGTNFNGGLGDDKMHCTPVRRQTAKKQHQCTNCGEAIEPGTSYYRWMSVDGDKAFSNKIHIECLRSLIDENGAGFWEYSPFGGERPNTEIRPRNEN